MRAASIEPGDIAIRAMELAISFIVIAISKLEVVAAFAIRSFSSSSEADTVLAELICSVSKKPFMKQSAFFRAALCSSHSIMELTEDFPCFIDSREMRFITLSALECGEVVIMLALQLDRFLDSLRSLSIGLRILDHASDLEEAIPEHAGDNSASE